MEQNQLLEDVEFIKKMIENNRRSLVDNGINYIATGIYVVVGVTISYFLEANGKGEWLNYMWPALMAILITVSFFTQKRIEKRSLKKTFASRVFASVWIACGIPILIVSLLFFITHSIPLKAMFACISASLGIGYYLTGVINDLRFMKYLAFGWWAGVALSMLWSYFGQEYQLALFFTFLVVILEIVPGIIIYKKWKNVYNG